MSDPVEYRGDVAGLWEWLAEWSYAFSLDLYTDDATTDPGVWVATALIPGGWESDDVTIRGGPAPTPLEAVASLWDAIKREGVSE